MATLSQAAAAPGKLPEYSSEVRFGVVMYGGVSLAIYINGVANEMYEMACATPLAGPSDDKLTGTREFYRRLSWLVDNPGLRKHYCENIKEREKKNEDVWQDPLSVDPNLHPARFVVDVISGTSAGGINGIFLAKALVNGVPFDKLEKLWLDEGDIGLLLNDRHSYRGLPRGIKWKGRPESLLNGDRMYLKLITAMDMMHEKPSKSGPPLLEEMDLFVTTTDIAGAPVPLRLSGQVVYERRHKQNFHFSYSKEGGRNDFGQAQNGLLAFAARCTSSFPFAFEPMTMERVKQLKPRLANDIEKHWPSYFAYLPQQELLSGRYESRAFGDGGYLDNKPFSYVVQALATRQAVVPVERKLIYVEPAPDDMDPDQLPETRHASPDALSNSLAALTGIPRYETIREDLQDILKRNRAIERVDRIVREGESDLDLALQGNDAREINPFVRIIKDSGGTVPPWPVFTRSKMVRYYGTAILAYRRMRVSATTDALGRRLAELWGVDPGSDHLYALTALVRTWRDERYRENGGNGTCGTINLFLGEFDIDYRIRKLGFLLRQIDHLRRLIRKCRDGLLKPDEFPLLPEQDQRSIERLEGLGLQLREEHPSAESLHHALAALHVLKIQINDAQGKWRLMERQRGREHASRNPLGSDLREQLNSVLSMLLGERSEASLSLQTVDDSLTGVVLSESTLKAVRRARTMQESVLIRARGLFEAASIAKEKTRIQQALEDCIDSLKRTEIQPGVYTILGSPTLKLEPTFNGNQAQARMDADTEKVEVVVEALNNPPLDTQEGVILRRYLGEHFLYFDLFDQMSFPFYHDTGIGEPATVEVTRISPTDAINLINESMDTRRKLAGTALANFGAFIDRNWRENDVMWGRLDGAERLIHAVLPMQDEATETVRNELVHLTQSRILKETLVRNGTAELTKMLCKAIAELRPKGDAKEQINALLERVLPGQPQQQHEHLAGVLVSLLDEHALLNYVRQTRDIDRKTDPKKALSNASRAVTILGCMLEGISQQQEKSTFAFRWLARFGLIFQGLVAASLPDTITSHWRIGFMKLLYMVGALLALFALVTGTTAVLSFAVKMLVITFTAHIVIFVLSDIMRSQVSFRRKGLLLSAVVVAVLAVFGSMSAYNNVQDWVKEGGGIAPVHLISRLGTAVPWHPFER